MIYFGITTPMIVDTRKAGFDICDLAPKCPWKVASQQKAHFNTTLFLEILTLK